jgi:hypothetical protein
MELVQEAAPPCVPGAGEPCSASLDLHGDADDTEPDDQEELGPELDWEVAYEGSVNVHKSRHVNSDVIYPKWKCSVVRGRRAGDWVKLSLETGYISLVKHNETTMKPIPIYAKLSNRTCRDIDMHPIHDDFTCNTAAQAMKLRSQKTHNTSFFPTPEGCHLFVGSRFTGLFLSTNPINIGNGGMGKREQICSSYAEPSTKCAPVTSTTTTRFSSTTWGWPSMLCITVADGTGYSFQALKDAFNFSVGVFACNANSVFTSGDPLLLGTRSGQRTYTTAISLDAGSFMPIWKTVKALGLYKKFDWTVKVSPETVFLPERLRTHLKEHTIGVKNFVFEKCDKFSSTPLYGALDVRSRGAIQQFFWNEDNCRSKLEWDGPNEDEFLQKCLDTLNMETFYDPNLLSTNACGEQLNCWDKAKAAFHGLPDFQGFQDCWRRAMQ